jgi:divalent metal cation (Fe/Co/Zn/Cd) transporter
LHVGPEALLVAAKVAVAADRTAVQIADGIDQAEQMLRAAVPQAEYVFIEPDLDRSPA